MPRKPKTSLKTAAIDTIKDRLLRAGVKSLQEYGYPNVTVDNICTDQIYRAFFRVILLEAEEAAQSNFEAANALKALLAATEKK